MRILLAGDLHIGRSTTGLSSNAGHDDLRAATAWRRLVEAAISEQVALVCLSGDIVDRENKLWESIGPLEEGIDRLRKHGIRTVAVAGNHDFDVLARLADMMPGDGLKLLGRGGSWERMTIEEDGRNALHIDGWSFPTDNVRQDPLMDYNLDRDTSVPTLGMVHGDLYSADSRYAPLSQYRLGAAGPDAWLLGHIHQPALTHMPRGWLLYPGSTQALDFGEPGAHGVWLVDVDGRLGTPRMQPLSTVRFDRVEIDVSGCTTQEDVERAIVSRIRSAASDAAAPVLKHLALRLDRDTSVPTLGMVHGDLYSADSRYAPLSQHRLGAAGPDAWLLGHIHQPALTHMPRGWLLYPGSTQALDFGEPGAHGVWLVDVDGRLGTPRMQPLSTVRFDRVEIDVSGCTTQEDVERAIVSRIRSASSDAAAPVLKHLALRLDIVGRTPIAPQIEEITRHLVDDLALNEQGVSVEINRMRISVLPEVDLESYASTNTAPGAVARLLLALEQSEPSEEAAQLIEQARRQLMGVDEHRAFSTLPRPEISVEVAREYVRDQARALLNKLVEQSP